MGQRPHFQIHWTTHCSPSPDRHQTDMCIVSIFLCIFAVCKIFCEPLDIFGLNSQNVVIIWMLTTDELFNLMKVTAFNYPKHRSNAVIFIDIKLKFGNCVMFLIISLGTLVFSHVQETSKRF